MKRQLLLRQEWDKESSRYPRFFIRQYGSLFRPLTGSVFFILSFFLILFGLDHIAFGLSSGQSANKAPIFLREINLKNTPGSIEVEILCDEYSSHQKIELSNPNKIVIDFMNIDNILASRRIQVDAFGIQAIRAGMFKSNVARIVFDLDGKIPVYRIERIPRGAKIIFPAPSIPATGPVKKLIAKKEPMGSVVLLKEIMVYKTQDIMEVEILCDKFSSYRYTYYNRVDSANPKRIVIDFMDINDVQANRITQVNDFGVQTVRVNMLRPDVARVVFDLEDNVPNYSIEKVQGGLKVSFITSSLPTDITSPITSTTTSTTSPTTTTPTSTISSTTTTSTTYPTTSTTTTFPTTTTTTSTTSPTTTTPTSTISSTTTTSTTSPTTSTTTTFPTTTTTFPTTSTTTTFPTTTTTTTTTPTTTTTTTTTTFPTTTTTTFPTTTTTTITTTTSPTTTTSTSTTTTTTTSISTTTTTATLPPPPPPPTTTVPSFEAKVTSLTDFPYQRNKK